METNDKNQKEIFEKLTNGIRNFLCNFSVKDNVFSLLVSNLWLPNISSGIKHQLLYGILLSTDPETFSKESKIKKYKDFESYIKNLYSLIPEFPWLEDYVPETDWGEIKFHHKEKDYKIFYGNEIGNVFDFLMLFQQIYSSYDEKYIELESRSPSEELAECLSLQDILISSITVQPGGEKLKISPGDLATPSEEFWNELAKVFEKFNVLEYVSKEFVDRFSCTIGSLPKEKMEFDNFNSLVFDGGLLPFYFIKLDNGYIPILPRRFSTILLDNWSEVFKKHQKTLNEGKDYEKHISTQIYGFLKKRFKEGSIFPFVSAINDKDKRPNDIVFASSFVSKDRLILLYSPAPFSDGKELSERLSKENENLKKSLELIKTPPITLGLRAQGQLMQYTSDSNGETLKPELIMILSQTDTCAQSIPIAKDFPGRVIFLDQFLGVFDEIEDVNEVTEFLEYLEEIEPKFPGFPFSFIDKYGSFKDSAGVLINGANDPDLIMLDPNWGSNLRYKTLKKFWEKYPPTGFFDHPRSWKIELIADKNIRLVSKSYFGCSMCCNLANSFLFITAAFEKMTYEQGLMTNLLMELLEDYFRRNIDLVKNLSAFRSYKQININLFPWSLVKNNEDFKHLRHLDPSQNNWRADIGWPKRGLPGVRFVFNDERLMEDLEKTTDSKIEVDLFIEILRKLDEFIPDTNLADIEKQIETLASNKPRFKVMKIQKIASFPEFVSPYTPSVHFQKEAAKTVSQLLKNYGLVPGKYKLVDAESRLNSIRVELVKLIDTEVKKYNFPDVITYLIERTDALVFDYERKLDQLEQSIQHDVDYERDDKFAKNHSTFVGYHKAYRYLIEKFVQIKPIGTEKFSKEKFQRLIALVGKLLELYDTSDSIHYGIYQAGLKINPDFTMKVKYKQDLTTMELNYGREIAKLKLGLIGNEKDRVDSPRGIENFLNDLDTAFKNDLKFSNRTLVNVLQILCEWAGYVKGVKENTWYSASELEITEACKKNIKGVDRLEIPLILDFLTLKSEEVIRLVGKNINEPDIPVWEFFKRSSRYNLRPLIKIKDKFVWGPCSVRRSGIIWAETPSTGQLPYDFSFNSIKKVIEDEKKSIENALVDKTLEIVKRFSPFAEKDVFLHKRDGLGGHPEILGDYDVIAYYPEKNVILNIEDKDLLPSFCLKDTKRLRDSIFGKGNGDIGYLERVERRGDYLKNNLGKIAKILKWQIDLKNPPTVISLFVSRQSYWWTMFPSKHTDVKFIRIDVLGEYINSLK